MTIIIKHKCFFYKWYIFMLMYICLCSCKKLVEVEAPSNSQNAENVYNNDESAAAVLANIFTRISETNPIDGSTISPSLFLGLYSDELTVYSGSDNLSYLSYYHNDLTATRINPDYWKNFYPLIYSTNAAIEGLTQSTMLTSDIRNQLLGEAMFLRAFFYSYIVRLYADIPLILTTDFENSRQVGRTSKSDVWKQITEDLTASVSLLSASYLKGDALTPYATGSEERVRPTQWAALALLARSYLEIGDFAKAAEAANKVIENITMFDLTDVNETFLKNSKEAIWQIQPVVSGWNTEDAKVFILQESGFTDFQNPFYLSKSLTDSFEINDKRRILGNWVDSITIEGTGYLYPNKYKVGSQNNDVQSPADMQEYLMVIRLAEIYLIRAEANAQLNDLSSAVSDLDKIRNRADLDPIAVLYPSLTKEILLAAISRERKVELFTEWGHRWFDLLRNQQADLVMSNEVQIKGGEWKPTDKLFPIPVSELQKNPKLVQNSGY